MLTSGLEGLMRQSRMVDTIVAPAAGGRNLRGQWTSAEAPGFLLLSAVSPTLFGRSGASRAPRSKGAADEYAPAHEYPRRRRAELDGPPSSPAHAPDAVAQANHRL